MNPSKVAEIFAPAGSLSRVLAPHFEWRSQQGDMAEAVYRTLNQGGRLLVEAPTGVGKSLAYLLPGILWAIESRSQLLISTYTRGLQDQILEKDLPHARRIINREIRAVVLKGRSNYLCRARWNHYLDEVRGTAEGEDLERALGRWAEYTETGDLSEAPVPEGKSGGRILAAFPRISSEGRVCATSRCSPDTGCFYKLSRARARDAHLVIVNHALLVLDLFSDTGGLPEWKAGICDEAHHLPRVAAEPLSYSVSEQGLEAALKGLGGRGEPGLSEHLRKALRAHPDREEKNRIQNEIRELETETSRLSLHARSFWAELRSAPAFPRSADLRLRYGPGAEVREDLFPAAGLSFCSGLQIHLDRVGEMTDQVRRLLKGSEEAELLEGAGQADAARAELTKLEELLTPSRSGFVYWIEPASASGVALRSSPLEVGPQLLDALFRRKEAFTLTSATLALDGAFEHQAGKLGLEPDSYEGLALSTPFHLEEQVGAWVLAGAPEPNQSGFPEFLAEGIVLLSQRLRRKMLVLFTAHEMLRRVEAAARGPLEERGIRIFAQGLDGGHRRVRAGFQGEGPAVLLGAAGFWEGVDFPGEELEVLLMARLPFLVPTDPLVEAMQEKLRSEGRNPFQTFYLPEALTRFRQGFGRLIRRREDRGLFVVADPRLKTRAYGALFERAVGVSFRTAPSWEALADAGSSWFGEAVGGPKT